MQPVRISLDDISPRTGAGRAYGLVGRNGSGKTMILVSHSSEDNDVLCEEVVNIEHGKIV